MKRWIMPANSAAVTLFVAVVGAPWWLITVNVFMTGLQVVLALLK